MMATDMGSADVRPGANIDLFAKMTGIEFPRARSVNIRAALEEVRFMPYSGLTPELTSASCHSRPCPVGSFSAKAVRR